MRPSVEQAESQGPAAKRMRSPSSMARRAAMRDFSCSERNLTMGDFHSPFSILMKARPFAPERMARSVRDWIWPVVMEAKPLALIALTTPPESSAERKTLKEEFWKMSLRSMSSEAKRRSGLSEPKRLMASW